MNKNRSYLILALASLMALSCGKSLDTGKKLKTPLDSFSYMLGLRTAVSYKAEGLKEIDYSSFARGFEDGIKKDSGFVVPEKSANRVFQGYLQQLRGDAEKKAKEKSTKWLEDNKKKSGVEVLPSKAQFKTISKGNGPVPTLNDTVIIHFKVKDLKGNVLQNTEDMKKPLTIPIKFIPIEGLREWITRSTTGSKATLYVQGPLPGYEARDVEEEFSIYLWEMNLIGMNPGPTMLEEPAPAGNPANKKPSAAIE